MTVRSSASLTPQPGTDVTRWWVGAYGADMGGTATGIATLRSRPDGSLEYEGVVEVASPSYLLHHGDHLYAALEREGAVESFWVDDGALVSDGRVTSGGGWPCHLAPTEYGVIVANYLDGNLGVLVLGDGFVSTTITVPPAPGSGPRPEQDGPHAHASFFLDNDTQLSLDLGTDRIHIHRVSGDMVQRTASVVLAAGTGPRDIARHPSGLLYVLGELSGALLVFEWVGGELREVASLPLPGMVEGDHASGISFGPRGRFVYVGLRGSHRIAVLRASDDGRNLEAVGWVSSEGEWPRHHATDGDILHVANQLSNGVASFRLGADGMPTLIAEPTEVPSPTFLLAVAP